MASSQSIRLYNTLTRSVDTLSPINAGEVRIYCCGPTVYHFQHIGNLRTYVFEDLLVRTIRAAGHKVTHVMNITDVGHLVGDGDAGDDKMAVAAKREKKKSHEIADYYTQVFFDDCKKLNVTRPSIVCKATDHIAEMINLIKRLEANGCTYIQGGNVYFDISKAKDYGKLARLDLSKLEAGARIEVDANKKNAHDFVLWFTKSKFEGQELQWDSPWGRGYPGWHIECSAMSMKYLGESFDIHCGGIDHIPVHHTNEIAQSESATHTHWVNIWMHGGFLVNENKEKMAKSTGGFICLKDIVDRGFDPVAYRWLCLGAHYRTQLSFSWDAMAGAAQSLDRLKKSVLAWKAEKNSSAASDALARYRQDFFECFYNDLNAPQSLATLWAVASDKSLSPSDKLSLLLEFDAILGLGIADWKEETEVIPQEVTALVEQRDAARKAKDWKMSDVLRDQIKGLGYTVEDSAAGVKVRKGS
jgi:cysteinyl-tRNA synthetase